MKIFDVIRGNSPVVLAQPHGGTFIPDDLVSRLNARGRGLDDTDWHITRLYDGLLADATIVKSNVHRYVIDANRDPLGKSLYPGQNTTGLCPVTDFDGRRIWQDGQDPSPDEIATRLAAYHAPYHQALAEELDRVRGIHGFAVLYDCHSIRSEIPFLFEGALPVFNIGTSDGTSCAAVLQDTVHQLCLRHAPKNTVLNGRFRGGWTTRHYGQPENGIHAIQMELAQRAYMQECAPWDYLSGRADATRAILSEILMAITRLAGAGGLESLEGEGAPDE